MKVKGRRQSKNVSHVGKTSGKQGRNLYSFGDVTKAPSLGKKFVAGMETAPKRDRITARAKTKSRKGNLPRG